MDRKYFLREFSFLYGLDVQLLKIKIVFLFLSSFTWGHAVAYLDEALSYKPEGRGIESR
jgi:hypothetical protein